MYSLMAESIPEDFGQGLGPPALRGNTCAAVMSKFFRIRRRQLALEASALRVREVRVKGAAGVALLSLRGMPARYIRLRRERGAWRMHGLLAGEFE
jgi:hypothetical protein